MTGITNLVKMNPITSLNVIELPSGKFGYVGKVPVEIGYIDPTPEKLEAANFGARFGPKTRTFATKTEAVIFANEAGYEIDNA